MMSFPQGHAENKVIQCPNMVQFAKVFEHLGLDLRIVFLDRSPESILKSTIINRRQGFSLRVHSELYVSVYKIILAQLSRLDPEFTVASFSVENSLPQNTHTLAPLKHFLGFDDAMIADLLSVSKVKPPACIRSDRESNYEASLLKFYREAYKYRELISQLNQKNTIAHTILV